MLFSSRVTVWIRFSIWWFSGYPHVFVLITVVTVWYPIFTSNSLTDIDPGPQGHSPSDLTDDCCLVAQEDCDRIILQSFSPIGLAPLPLVAEPSTEA